GLEIDDEMKWLLLISLASLGRIDDARLADELSVSHTATNELYYRTALAALPDLQRRRALWTQIYDGVDGQGAVLTNAQVTASARGLAASHPEFLTELFPKLMEGLRDVQIVCNPSMSFFQNSWKGCKLFGRHVQITWQLELLTVYFL